MPSQKSLISIVVSLQIVLVTAGLAHWASGGEADTTRLVLITTHALLLVILAHCLRLSARTQEKRLSTMNRQLVSALRRSQHIIEASTDMVWEIDADGCFTFVSDHNETMRDVVAPRVQPGTLVNDLVAADPLTSPESWARQRANDAAGLPIRDFCFSLPRTDGSIAHFRVNAVPVWSNDSVLLGYRGATRDQTAEIEALNVLNFQALHDPLTGLPNRRALEAALQQAVDRAPAQATVLVLDLDGFKTVNDMHGHAAGDQLLRLVAGRLSASIRRTDTAARLGGDEFGVVVLDISEDLAVDMARRLVDRLSAPYALTGDLQVRIGVSIGVVCIPDHGTDPETLLRRADQMLYDVKRSGGDGARSYCGQGKARPAVVPVQSGLIPPRSPKKLPADLQDALPRDEFWLADQPIRRRAGETTVSVEALL